MLFSKPFPCNLGKKKKKKWFHPLTQPLTSDMSAPSHPDMFLPTCLFLYPYSKVQAAPLQHHGNFKHFLCLSGLLSYSTTRGIFSQPTAAIFKSLYLSLLLPLLLHISLQTVFCHKRCRELSSCYWIDTLGDGEQWNSYVAIDAN